MSDNSFIHWSDEYNIEVEEVDLQHKYFARLINRLITSLCSTNDEAYVSMLLQEIIHYAVFHFTSEENIMFSYRYPDLSHHKEQHNILLEELNQNINYFKLGKIALKDVVKFLTKWFLHHTVEVDKQFGQYVVSEGKNKR